jgi:DNA polymerase-3 subunit delta
MMIFENILEDLKAGRYAPIYFLTGEETYYIDKISDYIEDNALSEEQKAFNQTVMYGKDHDAAAVINAAKRFPMMSDYQVIIVKEAQNLTGFDDFVYYASKPLKSTILVLNYKYKKPDKRKKVFKELEKAGVFFESKKLYEDKIPDWIIRYLKEKGHSIQTRAAILLTEHLGSDLQKIVMALEKLIITLPETKNEITTQHIEENIGISKEFNTIELQKALVDKDALKAFRIADYFGHNQKSNPIVMTITSLYFFFNKVFLYSVLKDKSGQNIAGKLKIHPYFVPEYQKAAQTYKPAKLVRIISLLREYDVKSKGVGNLSGTPHDLLKELIYKILN